MDDYVATFGSRPDRVLVTEIGARLEIKGPGVPAGLLEAAEHTPTHLAARARDQRCPHEGILAEPRSAGYLAWLGEVPEEAVVHGAVWVGVDAVGREEF